jgi:hypothetical protein
MRPQAEQPAIANSQAEPKTQCCRYQLQIEELRRLMRSPIDASATYCHWVLPCLNVNLRCYLRLWEQLTPSGVVQQPLAQFCIPLAGDALADNGLASNCTVEREH